MDNTKKILIGIAAGILIIFIFVVMGYTIKQQNDIIKALQQNTEQQRYLKDDITAVRASLLTKDEFNKKLESVNMDIGALKADLKKTGSEVSSILIATNTTPGVVIQNGSSSGFIPRPEQPNTPNTTNTTNTTNQIPTCNDESNRVCYQDTYGYFSKIPYYNLNEPTKNNQNIPFGQVTFDVTKKDPWGYKVYGRDYSTSVVIATDAVGKKTAYAKMTIKPNDGSNKEYSLPETQVQYYEKLPTAQMHWWNPRVFMGGDIGYSTKPGISYGPSLQMFVSSYGKIKQSSDWHFVGVGFNYDINNKQYNLAVTPVSYRILSNTSIFQNIYIAPTVTMGLNGNIAVLGGIRVGL